MTKKTINTGTEANKVDKVIISYLTSIGLSKNDFDTNFTISGKDRPDVAIKDRFGKYCIIFENKKDFKDLVGAKNQGLKYLEQLKNHSLLSDKILLIRTNMSTFHADEYLIQDGNIVWNKDITNIDILEDLKIELIKNYTHPKKEEELKLLSTDKQELKKTFDKINNYLRNSGLDISLRLHITSAMLFLKLIKENGDLFENIKHKEEEKETLKNTLSNLENSITETNIIAVFKAINNVYSSEFRFDLEKYKGVISIQRDTKKDEKPDTMLVGLYKIINETHLSNYDLDVKGEAFEYFINYGNTGSDMGEYFTPRHIVRFMVRLVDEALQYNIEKLSGKTFFDPTCGTGGFLIEIFKEVKEELKKSNNLNQDTEENLKKNTIFGNELNLRSSEIAKMNMILTGDGHSNIRQGDFISYISEIINKYDVSIGNPPFGNNREWEFVEGFLKCVKSGGYSIILVPEGVLFKADKNFVEIRKILLNKGKLLKVISLPQGAFLPYAGVKTNIIFWKNEVVENLYDIEFIEIKNDGFSLDANRRKLNNSDLIDYFENKQSLINKGQIWTVNSSQIYDKTKLNELELERSKLELEQKEIKKKLEILKKQLKQIDNKEEKELKQSKVEEIENKFEEIKKQTKKITDKLKGFDLNLVVNRYKLVKETNKNIHFELFGNLVEYLPKPKRNASDGQESGKYPFFTSSEIQNKWLDEADYTEECLIIGDGGKANINISGEFSANSHNFIIKAISGNILNKYLYFLLKYNLDILEAGFKGVGIKNISKEYLNNIQIPLVSLEYQEKIVKEIEEYEKFINGAKYFVENYKSEFEIKKEWDFIEIGEVCDLMTGGTPKSDNKDYYGGNIKWLVSGDIHKGKIYDCDGRITELGFKKSNVKILPLNSVLIALNGQGKTRGTVALLKTEATCNQSIVSINPNNDDILKSEFLYYYLKKEYKNIRNITGDSERSGLNMPIIKQIKIPLPTLEEQQRIVEELEKEQELVNANKELIKIFENKIRKFVKRIWDGE